MEALEIRGRLFLWFGSLLECASMLELAIRAREAFMSGHIYEEEVRYLKAMQAFATQQPDYDPKMQKASHFELFDRLNPRPFATVVDCHRVWHYSAMLAAVVFCQIFTTGSGASQRAKANKSAVMDAELTNILAAAFPDPTQRTLFDALRESLLKARHKMLGHADATEFHITHGAGVSSFSHLTKSIEGIDLVQWRASLEPFQSAVRERISALTPTE